MPFTHAHARGGTHERANAQAAHLGCNCAKGARMPDEMKAVA